MAFSGLNLFVCKCIVSFFIFRKQAAWFINYWIDCDAFFTPYIIDAVTAFLTHNRGEKIWHVDVIPVDLLQQNLPKKLQIKKVLRNLPKKRAVSSPTYFIIPPYEQIWRNFFVIWPTVSRCWELLPQGYCRPTLRTFTVKLSGAVQRRRLFYHEKAAGWAVVFLCLRWYRRLKRPFSSV